MCGTVHSFCCTGPLPINYRGDGRYPLHCPMEPGLSSPHIIYVRGDRTVCQYKDTNYSIFWVRDFQDCENWFVIAKEAQDAEDFYISYEGMNPDDSESEKVADLKGSIEEGDENKKIYFSTETFEKLDEREGDDIDLYVEENADRVYYARHAQLDDLEESGFQIIDDGKESSQRIAVLNGVLYEEGGLQKVIDRVQRDIIKGM